MHPNSRRRQNFGSAAGLELQHSFLTIRTIRHVECNACLQNDVTATVTCLFDRAIRMLGVAQLKTLVKFLKWPIFIKFLNLEFL